MRLTTHLYLVPRLGMSGAIPLLPPTRLHGVDRGKFAFLGAFAKLRRATISFFMSALSVPSVRMEQFGSHETDFHEI